MRPLIEITTKHGENESLAAFFSTPLHQANRKLKEIYTALDTEAPEIKEPLIVLSTILGVLLEDPMTLLKKMEAPLPHIEKLLRQQNLVSTDCQELIVFTGSVPQLCTLFTSIRSSAFIIKSKNNAKTILQLLEALAYFLCLATRLYFIEKATLGGTIKNLLFNYYQKKFSSQELGFLIYRSVIDCLRIFDITFTADFSEISNKKVRAALQGLSHLEFTNQYLIDNFNPRISQLLLPIEMPDSSDEPTASTSPHESSLSTSSHSAEITPPVTQNPRIIEIPPPPLSPKLPIIANSEPHPDYDHYQQDIGKFRQLLPRNRQHGLYPLLFLMGRAIFHLEFFAIEKLQSKLTILVSNAIQHPNFSTAEKLQIITLVFETGILAIPRNGIFFKRVKNDSLEQAHQRGGTSAAGTWLLFHRQQLTLQLTSQSPVARFMN